MKRSTSLSAVAIRLSLTERTFFPILPWRFFADKNGNANIELENKVKITKSQLDEFGKAFVKRSINSDNVSSGYLPDSTTFN